MRYRILRAVINNAKGSRKEMALDMLEAIKSFLQDAHIEAEVFGREKNLFSIYTKMKKKELAFHDVLDIFAFRIIVNNIDQCYRTLGAMHSLYKPRPGRFKDYIAIPKANGYQSLHTSLIGPNGVPVEIQIRTHDMNKMADEGVAAHWLYKDGTNYQKGTTSQIRAQKWMQALLEIQQNSGSTSEFVDSVKSDLFPEEIYVFTPDGRILELPVGATPVDFAYHVHTDIGHHVLVRALTAKLTLSQPLNSSNSRDYYHKRRKPNAAWMNFVVTGKARSRIREYKTSKQTMLCTRAGLLNHALPKIEDFSQNVWHCKKLRLTTLTSS